jgi:hypothetical protein
MKSKLKEQSINKTGSSFFKRLNENGKPLAKQPKQTERKHKSIKLATKADITAGNNKIQTITWGYFENLNSSNWKI